MTGLGRDPYVGDIRLGVLAVGGFFVISGYLITKSRLQSTFLSYAWRRTLRILPGYWVCLIFTGLVAAAIAGAVRGGWTPTLGIQYFVSNFDFWHGDGVVGTTLSGAPYPGAWNGSLWTLRYELACYLLVGLIAFFTFVRASRWPWIVIFVGSTVLSLVVHARGMTGMLEQFSLLLPFFAAGALLYKLSPIAPSNWKLGLSSVTAVPLICLLGYGQTLSALPFAYALIWLGSIAPSALKRLGSKNDYSYGMYLYGMPVQQLLVLLDVQRFGAPIFAVLSVAATAPLAVASWWLVESQAMKLKGVFRNKQSRNKSLSVVESAEATINGNSPADDSQEPDESQK